METNLKNKKLLKNILLYLGFALLVMGYIFTKSLNSLDEIWGYNFARGIANGLLPYKDISMIISPLLPMVCAIFLKIFGDQIIVLRILETFEVAGILFIMYKIMKELKINRGIALLLTIGIYSIYIDIFCLDYNWVVLLIQLSLLYYELKHKEDNLKYNLKKELILGLIAGSTILIKHTSGLFFAGIFAIYKILEVNNKEEFKEYIKITLTRIIGMLGAVLVLILYLAITGTMADFIDYAILGIKTFSNKVEYITLFDVQSNWIKALAGICPAQLVLMVILCIISYIKKKLRKQEWLKNIIILLAYSIATGIVIFPISDRAHFVIGSICTTIAFLYIAYKIFTLTVKKETKIKKVIRIYFEVVAKLLLIAGIGYSIYMLICYINNPQRRTDVAHFKNMIIDDEIYNRIQEMSSYIKEQSANGKKVYVLDATAATYQIPSEKYNKNYDMFNRGNLGSRGQNGVLADIENTENALLLIRQDIYKKNWQHPFGLTDYIVENYHKIGEVNIFDIYEK